MTKQLPENPDSLSSFLLERFIHPNLLIAYHLTRISKYTNEKINNNKNIKKKRGDSQIIL